MVSFKPGDTVIVSDESGWWDKKRVPLWHVPPLETLMEHPMPRAFAFMSADEVGLVLEYDHCGCSVKVITASGIVGWASAANFKLA